ncbi:RING-H2 finger protein ATL80-like [Typha angustifolia]|uniref:RING-H2 finger protein ATL80-like n=1 Tax=Typha angustifolia TaxID=59011 RepID=UPI003C2EA3A5
MANYDLSPSSGSSHRLHLNSADVIIITAFVTSFSLLSCLCCYRCLLSSREDSSSNDSRPDNNLTSLGDGNRKLEILASLPVFEFSRPATTSEEKKMDCAICQAELEEGERCRLLPRCNHWFHKCCIDMWLDKRLSCPLCRDTIIPQQC